jgi:hypothetical protein
MEKNLIGAPRRRRPPTGGLLCQRQGLQGGGRRSSRDDGVGGSRKMKPLNSYDILSLKMDILQ